jgi:hypothetical protein
MPINFQNPGYVSKNGKQSSLHSEHAIHSSVKRGGFLNLKASPNRMEAKLFLTVLSWLGVGSYIGAIILNIGSWKADILWGLAVMFGVVKFIRYSVKTWQDFRKGELEIKAQQKKIK